MTAEEFLGIKQYLKQALRLDIRTSINGDNFLVLLLENEIIDKVKLQIEYEE